MNHLPAPPIPKSFDFALIRDSMNRVSEALEECAASEVSLSLAGERLEALSERASGERNSTAPVSDRQISGMRLIMVSDPGQAPAPKRAENG